MEGIFTSCIKLNNGVIINRELRNNKLNSMVRTKKKVILQNTIDINQIGSFDDENTKVETAMKFSYATIVDALGYKKNYIVSNFYTYQLVSMEVRLFATIIECVNHRMRKDYEVYINKDGVTDLKVFNNMESVIKMLQGYSKPNKNNKNDDQEFLYW